MLLLFALALAADPPAAPAPAPAAPSAPGAPSAPAATSAPAPTAAPLRRTCDNAQLCDGRCIPWTETCASSVRASVEVMTKADSDAQRIAIICAAKPRASSEPVTPVQAVQAASAFSLCTGEHGNEIENCKQDPTGRDLLPDAPTSQPPPCGEVMPPEAAGKGR